MKKCVWLSTITLVAMVGCSPSNDTNSTAATSASSSQTAPGNSSAGAFKPTNSLASTTRPISTKMPVEPKDVVAAFLDSMRAGNAEQLASLLSTHARAEIERQGLEISPIGSPQAKFEIGEVEALNDTRLVASNWIEPGEPGTEPSVYEVVWELRQEAEGWRICCMAVDTHTPGEEVQVVNFEQLGDETEEPQRVASLPNASVNNSPVPPTPNNALPTMPQTSPSGLPPAGLPSSLPSGGLPPAGLPPTSLPPAGFNSGFNPNQPALPQSGAPSLPQFPSNGLPPSSGPANTNPSLPAGSYTPPSIPSNGRLPR